MRTAKIALASAALFAVFGGTAHALPGAFKVDSNDLRSNTVRSAQITNGQVKQADLSAGAVISATVADESLTGADIMNGSLTGDDVKDGSLGSDDVANGSLTSDDIQNNSLTSEDVQNNTLTGADVQNNSLTGDDVNEASLQGLIRNQIRVATSATGPLVSGSSAYVSANCTAAEKGIGGGGSWQIPGTLSPTTAHAPLGASQPRLNAGEIVGWEVTGRNFAGAPRVLRAYVICVPRA